MKIKPVKVELETTSSLNDEELAQVSRAEKVGEKTLFDDKKTGVKITIDDEDSDDELVAFDTSNDVPLATLKQPAYLRDCLHGTLLQAGNEIF